MKVKSFAVLSLQRAIVQKFLDRCLDILKFVSNFDVHFVIVELFSCILFGLDFV